MSGPTPAGEQFSSLASGKNKVQGERGPCRKRPVGVIVFQNETRRVVCAHTRCLPGDVRLRAEAGGRSLAGERSRCARPQGEGSGVPVRTRFAATGGGERALPGARV